MVQQKGHFCHCSGKCSTLEEVSALGVGPYNPREQVRSTLDARRAGIIPAGTVHDAEALGNEAVISLDATK